MSHQVHIYTDGAAKGNPGPGGYGVVMEWVGKPYKKEFYEGFRHTTNNRMELLAVIVGLEKLKNPNTKVLVVSDSKYVVNSINKGWLINWEKQKFQNRLNADLWQEYLNVSKDLKIKVIWVKGHADNEFNNRCDVLATKESSSDNKDLWLVDNLYEKTNKK